MLFSRFWYVILALTAATVFVFTLSASFAINRVSDANLEDSLRRDRFEIEMRLKVDARARIDALSVIASNEEIQSGLRSATSRRTASIDASLSQRIRTLNANLKTLAGDLVLLVDGRGRIIAHIGTKAPPAGSSLEAVPLVERALAGYLRDGMWVWDDQIYQMAARPVIDGGRYVGAVIHGKRFDDAMAAEMANRLQGATLAFFANGQIIARHTPATKNAVRAQDLATALGDGSPAADPKPTALGTGAMAIFAPVAGSPSEVKAGYVLARPRSVVGPFGIFDQLKEEDKLPSSLWAMVIGGTLVAILIGLLALWVERDRPLRSVLRTVGRLKEHPEERIIVTDLRGKYRDLSLAINDALDSAAQHGPGEKARKVANLGDLLAKGDEAPAATNFGFAPPPAAQPSGGGGTPGQAGSAKGPAATPPSPSSNGGGRPDPAIPRPPLPGQATQPGQAAQPRPQAQPPLPKNGSTADIPFSEE
ncbi:MAG: hypothetical protein KC416_07940, partial [Myxococcales bacterium]|nr:hypothetical protein [Myxococcales bacterium]